MRVLYLSYDGMLDPLGQSQVLPYLEGLAGRGHAITLVSFEKQNRLQEHEEYERVRAWLERVGIHWQPLRYHKRWSVVATAYDIAVGVLAALRLTADHQPRLIHARSYVAGVIGLLVKRVRGGLFIFDMRGFWVDERVDGGLWHEGGALYRIAKRIERWLFQNADAVVSLTAAGAQVIQAFPFWRKQALVVIPTCVDLDRFTPSQRSMSRARGTPLVIGYLGSLGTWYLFDEMIALFKVAESVRPGSILHVLSPADRAWIAACLRDHGIPESAYRIEHVRREDVPSRLASFDVSLAFYRTGSSRLGTCPTKLGESLACGVPVLATSGIGDVDALLAETRVGTVVKQLNDAGYRAAWKCMESLFDEGDALRERCRQAAKRFSLADGIQKYNALYRNLSDAMALD